MRKWIFLFLSLMAVLQAENREELKQRVIQTLPSLQGWCSAEKASAFIDLILAEKPKVWVEVGVFGGSSLFPVLSTFKFLGEGKAIAIDAWDKIECIRYYDPVKDKTDLRWWGNLDLNQIYSSFKNMLTYYEFTPFCTTLKMTSEVAHKEVPEEIDVLYLDGNHAEKPSLQDALLYLPKVRAGGYIWMNDVLWSSRQSAAEHLFTHCDVVAYIENGNCILFKKR